MGQTSETARNYGLTDLQLAFCHAYAASLRAGQAYRKAGYKAKTDNTAYVEGSKLLSNPKIRAYLGEIASLSQVSVINEVALIAFASITDVCEFSADGVTVIESGKLNDRGKAALKKVKHKTTTRTDPDGFEITTTEVEVELHDKLSALDKLIRKTCGGYPSSLQVLDAVQVLATNNVLTHRHAEVVVDGVSRIEQELCELSGEAGANPAGARPPTPRAQPGMAIREALGLLGPSPAGLPAPLDVGQLQTEDLGEVQADRG